MATNYWQYRPPASEFAPQQPGESKPKSKAKGKKETAPKVDPHTGEGAPANRKGGSGFINPSTGQYTRYSSPASNKVDAAAAAKAAQVKADNEAKKRFTMMESRAKFTAGGGWGMGAPNDNEKPKPPPTMNTGIGGGGRKALSKQKRMKFREIAETRELTDKEFKALSKDQQNMIRFSTMFDDALKSKDDSKIRALYTGLKNTGDTANRKYKDSKGKTRNLFQMTGGEAGDTFESKVQFDDFKRGMAALTEDDLFGEGKKKMPKKTAATPFFSKWGQPVGPVKVRPGNPIIQPALDQYGIPTGANDKQIEDQQYKRQFGGDSRKRLLAALTASVNEYMNRQDASEAKRAKLDTDLGMKTQAKAAAADPKNAMPVPFGLGKAVGLSQQQEAYILQVLDKAAAKATWAQPGADRSQVYETLKTQQIKPEAAAEYIGEVVAHRKKFGIPLGSNPKDTLGYDDIIKRLGIKMTEEKVK